jgi:hypothetical protein
LTSGHVHPIDSATVVKQDKSPSSKNKLCESIISHPPMFSFVTARLDLKKDGALFQTQPDLGRIYPGRFSTSKQIYVRRPCSPSAASPPKKINRRP